jgi:hypothetical protein
LPFAQGLILATLLNIARRSSVSWSNLIKDGLKISNCQRVCFNSVEGHTAKGSCP